MVIHNTNVTVIICEWLYCIVSTRLYQNNVLKENKPQVLLAEPLFGENEFGKLYLSLGCIIAKFKNSPIKTKN